MIQGEVWCAIHGNILCRSRYGAGADYPLQYPHTGNIVYDFPEAVPEKVKKLVKKAFQLHRQAEKP